MNKYIVVQFSVIDSLVLPYKYIYVLCKQEQEGDAERLPATFEGYEITGYVQITFPVLQNSTYTLILHIMFY